MKYEIFELVEKDGHKGIFIGEVDDKPVVVTLEDAPEDIIWNEAMRYAKNNGLRLPNQRELMLMYIHKEKLDLSLKESGGKPLENGWYWSSSEGNDDGYAWTVYANTGGTYPTSKSNYHYVRCVLEF